MDKETSATYIYSKVCGKLAKMTTIKSVTRLFNIRSLAKLWQSLFSIPCPAVTEDRLASLIETKSLSSFIKEYTGLLLVEEPVNPFCLELLRRYDIENLKALSGEVSNGEDNIEKSTRKRLEIELGKLGALHYDKFPDIEEVTKGTPYSWYHKAAKVIERQALDYHLDLQETQTLWHLLGSLRGEGRKIITNYLTNYYGIKNMLWALRLKTYYNYTTDMVIDNLLFVNDSPSPQDPICTYAYEVLEKDTKNFEDWKDWKFSKYINSPTGQEWTLDLVRLEARLKYQDAVDTLHYIHLLPCSSATLPLFFRLKQQELDYIRTASERLRSGLSLTSALKIIGVAI